MKHINTYLVLLITFFCISTINAQIVRSDWELYSQEQRNSILLDHPLQKTLPANYLLAVIDYDEAFRSLENTTQLITIPNPKGGFDSYEIWPVDMIPKDKINKRSAKTFRGVKTDDDKVRISFTSYELAVYVSVYGAGEDYYILPTSNGSDISIIYYRSQEKRTHVNCQSNDHIQEIRHNVENQNFRASNIRDFRIAFLATGEYSEEFGGDPYDVQNVQNAITAGLNLMAPVFERDFGITFTNVTPDELIYPDASTDPFIIPLTNNYNGGNLIQDSHDYITSAMESDNFDIGHLITWYNLGGLASTPSVCNDNSKGRGYSGNNGTLTSFWIDYVSHEVGHQFGALHNQSSINCNASAGFHFEPGDGSSIMSYAGLCNNSYKSSSDPYFHTSSVNRSDFWESNSSTFFNCATLGSAISVPAVSGDVVTIDIPKSTPFVLVGDGTADEYDWNQYDGNGPEVSGPPDPTCTDCANFRFHVPQSEPVRYLPEYENVLNGSNNSVTWERLSSVARTMNFKLTGRNNSGGFNSTDLVVNVSDHGPFEITYPNGGENLDSGSTVNVTWNVNGTNAIAPTVDIFFSSDNGENYTLMTGNTANDGSEAITLPNQSTGNGRILIQGHVASQTFSGGSTFYDISDFKFGIDQVVNLPPDNDNWINAIQGYYDQSIDGDLQFATIESTRPLSTNCNVDLVYDVWYKYVISNASDEGETFQLLLTFDTPGDYGLELSGDGFSNPVCDITANPNYFIGIYTLNGTGWLGNELYARVFKHTPSGQRPSVNVRAPESFTITPLQSSSLPVELVEFKGRREGQDVLLSWSTEMEINASHFDVMASSDAKEWEKVGKVLANGSSLNRINYKYIVENNDAIYYKLVATDLDDTSKDSEVLYIPLTRFDDEVIIYPNPVQDQLYVSISTERYADSKIEIFNVSGVKVLEKQINTKRGESTAQIDVSALQRGVYLIQIAGFDNYKQKIVIY